MISKLSRLFLLCFLFLLSCGEEKPTKPNIIILLADDQGWGDLSLHGNTNLSTPNIDALATAGASFDRFYVAPVCSPTRAELLTGRYHVRGGVYATSAGGERLNLDELTMGTVFKEAGYATAAYGKWHNGMQAPYHPNTRGFDDFYGFCSGHWGNYISPMLEHNGEFVKGKGFIIDDLTERGMAFMENHKDDPFLLYLPYNTPHSPMQVPQRWWQKFQNKELDLRNIHLEKEDVLHTKAALALCENIDWNVGRLTEKLETLGLTKNTIVVYLSDNGPNGVRWNGGMKGKKGSTDEGGIRSPLFVKWPGKLKAGKHISQITSVMDLLPTLADLAGIDFTPEKKLDGISLKPLLLEENPAWDQRYLLSHWGKNTSVRSQKYRLDAKGQLFDMEKDPGQTSDIAAQYPRIAKAHEQAKISWENDALAALSKEDLRSFTIGHPGLKYTQIPARDGVAHGNIQRSNKFPNCSFFTNWTRTSDSITWDVEVVESGLFEVEVYYTCAEENIGASFALSLGENQLEWEVSEAYNPPLLVSETDRVPREESYVKEFKKKNIGSISLEKGSGVLRLKATKIPGNQAMDFRLINLKRRSE